MTQNLAPAARQIIRNLTVLNDGTVLAGYRIGPTRWDFAGRDVKVNMIQSSAEVWSRLTGRYFQERVETRPAPVQAWARALDDRTPHPLPDVHTCDRSLDRDSLLAGRCGCFTWNALLRAQQERIRTLGMDDKVVFRYFGVGNVLGRFDVAEHLLTYLDGGPLHEKLVPILEDEKRVHDIVVGWNGTRRMTEREQAWLRKRSLAPSTQPGPITAITGGWNDMALPALAADARWHVDPFDRAVTLHSWDENGARHESAVRVLMLARVNDLDYPDNGAQPWQSHAERALDSSGRPFSVSWNVQGHLLAGIDLEKAVELDLKVVRNLQLDYREAGLDIPESVNQAADVALETVGQVKSGLPVRATRFEGTVAVAVTGQTRLDERGRVSMSAADVVEERCAALTRLYSGGALRMDLVGADDQAGALRTFVPGEPRERIGFQRRLRLDFLAAGGPTVTNQVGDGAGPLLGYSLGATARAFHHDSFKATEGSSTGRGQNMHVVAGTLGSGKSWFKGALAFLNVRRGIPVVVSDPSGPLAALCDLPDLREHSQVVDLAKGASGLLSPPALIREPSRDDYDKPGDYAAARAEAQAERRDLVVDMARRCLDDDDFNDPRVRQALRQAASLHGQTRSWEITSTMWDLVAALEILGQQNDVAATVAQTLIDASTAPLLRLMFPPRGLDAPSVGAVRKMLTVIIAPGIVRAADGVPRRDWIPSEIGADAVLRLIGLFTNRLIFTKARSDRMMVIFDEAEVMTDTGAGRSELMRLGRDHSKWNIAVYLGVKSVNPQMLSGELKNFVGSVFAGKMASIEPARAMLDLLGLEGDEYARTLINLSQVQAGEFVHRDVAGNLGRIRIDVDYIPHLRDALDTNPAPEGSDHWNLDEEMMA